MEPTIDRNQLRPRPLYDDDRPEPGDLHFAVGFGADTALVSKIIAAGTASRTNHVGVITGVSEQAWTLVEALGKGVVVSQKQPPPRSTVIRISDDPSVRSRLAASALERQAASHIGYDWWTIARIVMVGLVGRIPFLFFPLLLLPPVARYTDPVWIGPAVAVVLFVVFYRLRLLLFRVAVRLPWPNSSDRMICSEFARTRLEAVFGPDALPGLAKVAPSMTAPGDLLQALLGRSDYGTSAGRVKNAELDAYRPAKPVATRTVRE